MLAIIEYWSPLFGINLYFVLNHWLQENKIIWQYLIKMAVMTLPTASPRLSEEPQREWESWRGMYWGEPKGWLAFFLLTFRSRGTGTRLNPHMAALWVQLWIWKSTQSVKTDYFSLSLLDPGLEIVLGHSLYKECYGINATEYYEMRKCYGMLQDLGSWDKMYTQTNKAQMHTQTNKAHTHTQTSTLASSPHSSPAGWREWWCRPSTVVPAGSSDEGCSWSHSERKTTRDGRFGTGGQGSAQHCDWFLHSALKKLVGILESLLNFYSSKPSGIWWFLFLLTIISFIEDPFSVVNGIRRFRIEGVSSIGRGGGGGLQC